MSRWELARGCRKAEKTIGVWEDSAPYPPDPMHLLDLADALGLDQYDTDRWLVAAGYAPSYSSDCTVRQLVRLLRQSPEPVVQTLRAQIAASYHVLVLDGDGVREAAAVAREGQG
jgi:hypothetical protein